MSHPPFSTTFQSRVLTGSGSLPSFLAVYLNSAEGHRRRLAKVPELARNPMKGTPLKISPLAGKLAPPAILVDVPRLVTAYYSECPIRRCRRSGWRLAPPGTAARRSTGPSTKPTFSR